ncbi:MULTISPECIES: hypothetical protein [unclassified Saccharopolyspora]|uniref:hypothetical protein n=1 Tax=Saccharopolyspora TaxID=1835 RepID=UPI00190DC61F|nr:hypothetical protein [Saccharopolyspora sp. HNM0986]MBK0865510.1 hypothetical protein [Saccharopolyspora sp. HNM0986]
MRIAGREYLVIVERDDQDGFNARVAGLPGVAAAAAAYDECVSRVRAEVEEYLAGLGLRGPD